MLNHAGVLARSSCCVDVGVGNETISRCKAGRAGGGGVVGGGGGVGDVAAEVEALIVAEVLSALGE